MDLNEPWKYKRAAELDSMTLEAAIHKEVQSEAIRRHLWLFAQTVLACDPSKVSFLFFLVYMASGGGMEALGDGEQGAQKWKLAGGTQQLSVRLKEEIEKRGGEVRLSAPVEEVVQLRSAAEHGHDLVKVVCLSSSSEGDSRPAVFARKVVFAISPVLVNEIKFTPPLPSSKQELCRSYIQAAVIKVFAIYATPFWVKPARKAGSLPHFSTLGPVHNVFHAEFGRVFALVGLITGPVAKRMTQMSAKKRRRLVLEQYATMYDDPIALEPLLYFEADWQKEQYSGGCFVGLLPPGVLSKLGPWLRAPFGPFHWCCSETSTHFNGYFEGAVRSAHRVVQEIVPPLAKL